MRPYLKCPSKAIRQVVIARCALIYTGLLVMSSACTLAHAEQVSSHHHHHGEERSSDQHALCAWTCQATADAAVTIGSSPTVTELLVGAVDLASSRLVRSSIFSAVHARAPPSRLFVGLG
ncbi:MAG: hypothetical protein E8D40_14235 [Nitrospira sp.]|nr:MAG: hypothetical protein E8D40_14235 [Nitrospira sp.]